MQRQKRKCLPLGVGTINNVMCFGYFLFVNPMLNSEIRFIRVRMTKGHNHIFMLESHSSTAFLLVVCFALNVTGLAIGFGTHRLL